MCTYFFYLGDVPWVMYEVIRVEVISDSFCSFPPRSDQQQLSSTLQQLMES